MIAKFYPRGRGRCVRRVWGNCVLAGVLWGAAAGHAVGAQQVASAEPVRQHLIQLREAVSKKQWKQLPTLAQQARDDKLLGDYASYWLLRWQTQDPKQPIPTQALQHFIKTSTNGLLVERLQSEWLMAATRARDYATALRLGPLPKGGAPVQCAWQLARHRSGQKVTSAEAFAVFAPGASCWAMLERFAKKQVVSWGDLVTELRAILETSRRADAQRMASILFDAPALAEYVALMRDPMAWLEGRQAPKTRTEIELVTLALSRLARETDQTASAAFVQQHWEKTIPRANLEWVWSQFGLIAALRVDTNAWKWYRRSGTARLTDYNHAWQVRAELRRPKIEWHWVQKAIARMSSTQQNETVWTYWLGRALAAQGDTDGARQRYTAIHHALDFYGLLASEELGRIQPLPPPPTPLTAAELKAARAHPGLRRAIVLFTLGWRTEAVQEWNYALRNMDDRALRAAAEVARQAQIFDRVINTSLRTQNEIDFSQRFIAPFVQQVSEKAREVDLEPAWVYGLIRQESRFIMNAHSPVGASGLMQLMPATAKWVAAKIGLDDFRPSAVNHFETNIVLGTRYLDMVLRDQDNSQLLASIGYNAGPARAVRWRAALKGPVEGAIFAETIPFTETRLYVKHVLSNATYYATLFSGQAHSLKARLGTVHPSPMRQVELP